jgi:hypothetical protein
LSKSIEWEKSEMLSMSKRKVAFWVALAVICVNTGCSLAPHLRIDEGYYRVVEQEDGEPLNPPLFIEALQVRRDKGEVVFFPRKGEDFTVPFTTRDENQWPAGCPGNLYSQKMEVLDLHVGAKAAEIMPYDQPVLVRDCPQDPYRLVLRADGEMGGASTACPHPEPCIFFKPSPSEATGKNGSCSELELAIGELQRHLDELETWNQALVEGYGSSVWYFGETRYPIFHHHPDQESMDRIVDELNMLFHGDELPNIRVESIRDRVVDIGVDDDIQLTQGMGSTGAQSYLKVVTYSLTSLPGIDCVNFQFSPGDHAQPDMHCRKVKVRW